MAFHRGIDGSDPIWRLDEAQEEIRPAKRSSRLGSGTLACPLCDAPVAPGPRPLSPADPIGCPLCLHTAAVRDFLSLAAPSRPAHVEVRVVTRAPLG